MIPNGMGIFFGIAQLALFYWAREQERLALLGGLEGMGDSHVPMASSQSVVGRMGASDDDAQSTSDLALR